MLVSWLLTSCIFSLASLAHAAPPARGPGRARAAGPRRAARLRTATAPLPEAPPLETSSVQRRLQQRRFSSIRAADPPPEILALTATLEAIFDARPAEARLRAGRLAGAPGGLGQVAARVRDHLDFNRGAYAELSQRAAAEGRPRDRQLTGLATLAPGRLRFDADAAPVPLSYAPYGLPLVEVRAGAATLRALFDTGAVFTSLSQSLAERLGVRPLPGSAAPIGTSSGLQVDATLGTLPRLRLGAATFSDLIVLVFPDAALAWRDAAGVAHSLELVVGWNVIRRGRAVLDGPAKTLRFTRSPGRAARGRNLAWLGYPMVELATPAGQPLLFGLDTGSVNTSVAAPLFDKLAGLTVTRAPWTIRGVGGQTTAPTRFVEHLALRIEATEATFTAVPEETYDDAYFVDLDGILGSDLGPDAVVVVDFPGGEYRVRCDA